MPKSVDQSSFAELSESCEKQPEARAQLIGSLAFALAKELFDRGLLDECPATVAGLHFELISKSLSEAYSSGLDAGFRLQLSARGRGRSAE